MALPDYTIRLFKRVLNNAEGTLERVPEYSKNKTLGALTAKNSINLLEAIKNEVNLDNPLYTMEESSADYYSIDDIMANVNDALNSVCQGHRPSMGIDHIIDENNEYNDNILDLVQADYADVSEDYNNAEFDYDSMQAAVDSNFTQVQQEQGFVSNAQGDVNNAQTTVNTDQNNVNVAQSTVDSNQTVVDSDQTKADSASQEVDNSQQEVDTNQNKVQEATLASNQAAQETNSAQQELQSAQSEVSAAESEVSSAQSAVQSAQQAVQDAQAKASGSDSEENKLSAQSAINAANQQLQQAQQKLIEAQQKLTEAQQKQQEAQQKVTESQQKQEEAQQEVTEVQQNLEESEDVLQENKTKLDEAQDKLSQSQEALQDSQNELDTKQDILKNSQETLGTATEDLNEAQDSLKQVENTLSVSQNEAQQAQNEVKTTKAEKTDAGKELQKTQDAVNNPDNKIEKVTTSDGKTYDLNKTLENRINEVSNGLKDAKSQNGVIGKAWDWVKNTTGIGDSSDKVVDQQQKEKDLLKTFNEDPSKRASAFEEMTGEKYTDENKKKFIKGEIQLKSEKKLDGYKSGQNMAVEVATDVASFGAAAATTVATGGNLLAGMAAGSLTKTGMKALECRTSEDRTYSAVECAKDSLMGAVQAPMFKGAAWAGKAITTKVASSLVSKGVSKAAASATAKVVGEVTENAAIGAADSGTRTALEGGSASEIVRNATAGAAAGGILGPVGNKAFTKAKTLTNKIGSTIGEKISHAFGSAAKAAEKSVGKIGTENIGTVGAKSLSAFEKNLGKTNRSYIEGVGSRSLSNADDVIERKVARDATHSQNVKSRNAISNAEVSEKAASEIRSASSSGLSEYKPKDAVASAKGKTSNTAESKGAVSKASSNSRTDLDKYKAKEAPRVDSHEDYMDKNEDLFDRLFAMNGWMQALTDDANKCAWKMHLYAANESDWQKMSEALIPYLKENNINFKTLDGATSPEYLASNWPDQAGKAFTIYPHSNEEMARLASDLDYIIKNNNLQTTGSNIIGDRQMGDSGRLFYRYEYKSGADKNKIFDVGNEHGYNDYLRAYDANRGADRYLASDMTDADDIWLNFNPALHNKLLLV